MNEFQTGFNNPNEDPGNTQRLLLAFALIFLVIIASQYWLSKKAPPKTEQQQKAASTQAQNEAKNQTAPTPPATTAASTPSATAPAASPAAQAGAPKQANTESETVVENDLYKITFTNRGAAVKSWILKNQQDEQGHPLDLVNGAAAARYGYPLSIYTYDADLNQKLNGALFVAATSGSLAHTAPGGPVTDKTGRAQAERIKEAAQQGSEHSETVTFEYSDGDTQVRKVFRFDETYVVHADISVVQKGAQTAAMLAWPAGFGDQTVAASYSAANIAYNTGSDIERLGTAHGFLGRGKIATNGETVKGTLAWAGPEDQYFAAIFLPDNPQAAQLVTFNNKIPQDPKKPDDKKTFPVVGAAVGNINGTSELRIFVGPKFQRVLTSVHAATLSGESAQSQAAHEYTGPTLDNLIDFGFFSFFAKPLFLWLRWTYEHVIANWGWSILIVTIIINLALLPLRIKQMRSSMRMMKVQPQITAINNKYKGVKFSDAEKMNAKNAEIQAIYKREGINPMGGCLPVLVQLPILWAFFKVLEITVELRHAPWLWIKDLSAPDPLHLIPIALIISMFMLQRMTPTPGVDPVQAKMMQITMPLMFGFFSWYYAAGLSVYYTAGNFIMIAQQMVLNRTSLGREMREVALKRARAAQGRPPLGRGASKKK